MVQWGGCIKKIVGISSLSIRHNCSKQQVHKNGVVDKLSDIFDGDKTLKYFEFFFYDPSWESFAQKRRQNNGGENFQESLMRYRNLTDHFLIEKSRYEKHCKLLVILGDGFKDFEFPFVYKKIFELDCPFDVWNVGCCRESP